MAFQYYRKPEYDTKWGAADIGKVGLDIGGALYGASQIPTGGAASELSKSFVSNNPSLLQKILASGRGAANIGSAMVMEAPGASKSEQTAGRVVGGMKAATGALATVAALNSWNPVGWGAAGMSGLLSLLGKAGEKGAFDRWGWTERDKPQVKYGSMQGR